MIRPPGFTTRWHSESTCSGFSTSVMTNCATTQSNVASAKDMVRIHHPDIPEVGIASARHLLARLRQHRRAEIDADDFGSEVVIIKRQTGAYADFQDLAADIA